MSKNIQKNIQKNSNNINVINNQNKDVKIKWNLLIMFIKANVNCQIPLKQKIMQLIDSTLYLFPKATINFKKRIDNIIDKKDNDNSTIMIILKDIIDFQIQTSYIESLIEELKSQKIIDPILKDEELKNKIIEYLQSKSSIIFTNFFINPSSIILFNDDKNDNNNSKKLQENIINRFYNAESTSEIKDLVYDLQKLINLTEKKIILPNIPLNRQSPPALKVNLTKYDKYALPTIPLKQGGANNEIQSMLEFYKLSDNFIINNKPLILDSVNFISNLLGLYKNFIDDTKKIFDSEKSKKARINAGLRIIGNIVLGTFGFYCTIGTIIPIFGSIASITCPFINFLGGFLSIFINHSRDKNSKQELIENNLDYKELLLFTLAKNAKIAWISDDKNYSNFLLKNEDGSDRTWYQFIIDVLAGDMSSYNIYNLCFVTMSSSFCENISHKDLADNYEMLKTDIDYIIKNVTITNANKNSKPPIKNSEFLNYLNFKKYSTKSVVEQLEIYSKKCDDNSKHIYDAAKLLVNINNSVNIDIIIQTIFNTIAFKINDNLYKKVDISDNNLKYAIICIINYIITNNTNNIKVSFPLVDKTEYKKKDKDLIPYSFNINYNRSVLDFYSTLEKKCKVDNNMLSLLLSYNTDVSKLKDKISKKQNNSLDILILSTLEVINKFSLLKLSNSRFDRSKETYSNSAKKATKLKYPSESISSVKFCQDNNIEPLDNSGNITDKCINLIKIAKEKCIQKGNKDCDKLYDFDFLDKKCGTNITTNTILCRLKNDKMK